MSDPISLPGASVVSWVLNDPAARHPLLVGLDTPNFDALLGLARLFGQVRGLVPPT